MSPPRIPSLDWRVILAVWAGMSLLLVVRTVLQFGTVPLYGDGDDAMRMTTALDLLNGQNWFDSIQHRDNAPFGASMHWSRLVDLPIAVWTLVLTPLFGALAPDVAAIVWPLCLLLPLIVLSVAMTKELIPDADTLTAAILPCLGLVLFIEFLPGRVDHHSLQILLVLTMVLALLRWRTEMFGGAIAAIAAAASLAIGLETLPFVIVAIAAYGLLWIADPVAHRRGAQGFGVALGGGAVAHLVIAVPPSGYLVAACDALSSVYVMGALLAGAALWVAATWLGGQSRMRRVWHLIAMGLFSSVLLVVLFPECLRGPYAAVDPRMVSALFGQIAEVQSFWTRLIVDPATGLAFCVPALVGLAVTLRMAMVSRGDLKIKWYILLGFLLVACLIMLVQIRGARFAGPLAIPAGVAIILRARAALTAKRSLLAAGGVVAAWVVTAGMAQFAIVATLVALTPRAEAAGSLSDQQDRAACFLASNYDALSKMPAARIMSASPIGAHILRYTPHSIVSAGFHRNNAGNLDQLEFFAGSEADARVIAGRRGIAYVAYCQDALTGDGAAGSFLALAAAGQHWSWLEPVSAAGDMIQIFKVLAGPGAEASLMAGELTRAALARWTPREPSGSGGVFRWRRRPRGRLAMPQATKDKTVAQVDYLVDENGQHVELPDGTALKVAHGAADSIGATGPTGWWRYGLVALLVVAGFLLALQMLGGNKGTDMIPGTPTAAPQGTTATPAV